MLAASTRLGPYQVVAPLGAGGMGEVYRARDTRLGREVAIKVLPEAIAHDADRRARFEREARAVAALTHPNILSIYDYGSEGAVTYAVMELLEGETLRDRLKKGPLSWREAVDTGAAIADGLAAAHAKGVVHRDLKPENLFLTCDGRVKILDFGLARITAVPNQQEDTSPYVPAATDPGTVMGTAGYMSPEQVRGQPAEAPSDIFSFGCVLYEMVTGRRAFHRETPAETMTAILHDEPPDSGVPMPAELRRLVRQCLAKGVAQRLHSARDLALALRAASQPAVASSAIRRGVEAVAVLPFENVGGDPKTEYLSDGVADHLIIGLLQVRREGLKVRPFSSVLRYKRQHADIPTIGKELGVQVIVTGTLHQVGDDLWLSVALVDAWEDNQVWGKRYQSKLSGILDVQDQIARDVATNLRLRLTGEEEQRLTRRYTEDPEAYLFYREARYHWNKFTEEGLSTSIEYCHRALRKDPHYALAYAQLGRSHVVLGTIHRGPRQTFPQARTYLAQALAIDDTLPDAHGGMGLIYLFHDWDWPAAERELKRATGADPSRAVYGFYLAATGRPADALPVIRQVQELNPLAAPHTNEVAMAYNWLRQYDQAIAEAQKALELDPDFQLAYDELGRAYVQKGMAAEAILALQAAINRGHGHPRVRGMLGCAYAAAGRRAEAERVLEQLKDPSRFRYGYAFSIARLCAALNKKDDAFAWLQKACDERDSWVIFVKVDPTLDNLRLDLRFNELLRHMGLPEDPLARGREIQSIAVLPFENVGGDPNTEFLSDGLADQIIDSLSQVRREGLKVRPFTSVARYKGRKPEMPSVARELDVQVVVTGTLHQQGEDLSIRVALADVQEDSHLWGNSYRGKLGEILDLQDRIARDVAANLRLRLTGEEERRLTKRYTEDPDAYLLYREARHHINKFTETGLETSIEYCRRALRKDPNYALAHNGLGHCYFVLGAVHRGFRDTYADARRAFERALALDPTLAEPHTGLAGLYLMNDWNWPAAKRELDQALALNPDWPIAWELLAFYYGAQGNVSEALACARRSPELDPLAAPGRSILAMCYNWAGQYDQAATESRKILELEPTFPFSYRELATASVHQGKHAEVIAELHRALDAGHTHPRVRGMLGYAYAKAGRKAEARRVSEELKAQGRGRFFAAHPLAQIYAALGENDEAFAWLKKACDERDSAVIWIKADPTLETLRPDPRFARILRDMGLPVASEAASEVPAAPRSNRFLTWLLNALGWRR